MYELVRADCSKYGRQRTYICKPVLSITKQKRIRIPIMPIMPNMLNVLFIRKAGTFL